MNKILKVVRVNDVYPNATIGKLYVNGEYFCDTLEPAEAYLYSHTPPEKIQRAKDCGRVCIPYGIYPITLEIQSPRYKGRSVYQPINFMIPRLINVPRFNGILIHIGNYPKDTRGCILVGTFKGGKEPMLHNSTETFFRLYDVLKSLKPTHIEITSDYIGLQHY